MITNNENIIGIFVEPAQADTAITDLEAHGFTPYHIRSSDERPVHGFLAQIKKLFTRSDASPDSNNEETQDIEALDIRHEDVLFYEHEMASGHVIVAINSASNLQEAIDIMQAHDAMTNYPIALYTSSHNEDTNTPQRSEAELDPNQATSSNTAHSDDEVITVYAASPKNNEQIVIPNAEEERTPLVQKTEKPSIHAHAKRTRSRSSQLQKARHA